MDFSIKFDTVMSGWSIVTIEGSQANIFKKTIAFLSLKIFFVLAKSENPDSMLQSALFHLDLHCL